LLTLPPCTTIPSLNLLAQVSVGVGSATNMTANVPFSYDPPHVSSWEAVSRPIGGSVSVTLFGNHFGPSDLALAPKIGSTLCLSPLFVSYTSIHCKIPPLVLRPSQGLAVVMVRGDQASTLSQSFSYGIWAESKSRAHCMRSYHVDE
jgi:hypothetical protein